MRRDKGKKGVVIKAAEVQKIRKAIEKAEAMKQALDKEEEGSNPSLDLTSILLFLKLGEIDSKISYVLGGTAVAVALLVAVAVVIF